METKKVFKYFTIFEYEKEQEYLRKMHLSGWKFVKVSGFCIYHFEKCVPQDVVYQLDYNKEGIAHKEEYIQLFIDCGWEYLQDYVGYSYFRKAASDMSGKEEIFCDEQSRRQMLERVYKGRVLPLILPVMCILLPGFIVSLSHGNDGAAVALGAALGAWACVLAIFVRQYFQLKEKR